MESTKDFKKLNTDLKNLGKGLEQLDTDIENSVFGENGSENNRLL